MLKEQNIALVRTVIGELNNNPDILQWSNVDVHSEYKEEHPNLEGNFLDMGCWVTDHECGTAACVAGWLARDPRIQAAGLTLELDGSYVDEYLVPAYGKYRSIGALQVFLGFSEHRSAVHVFGANNPDSFEKALERFEQSVQRERELQHA